MTEYWKSNERKFCDYCKCWLADNKISISFHESGKKHKENVTKRLSELSKSSAKDYKNKLKVDEEMRKMEAAAMASYMQDVKNNADLTSQNINKILEETNSTLSTKDYLTEVPQDDKIKWQQMKSEDGNMYYWNEDTNETTWEEPDGEYIPYKQEKKKDKKAKESFIKKKQEEAIEEVRAHMQREKMKELIAKPEESPLPVCGPAPRAADPYGTWQTINTGPQVLIDFELPKVEKPVAPVVILEPERHKFKEKTVTSLGQGEVQFKKRKLNSGAKKNIRQKNNDD